jgi:hypothetical protein
VVHIIDQVLIPPKASRRLLADATTAPSPAATLAPTPTVAECESGKAYDPACKKTCPKDAPYIHSTSTTGTCHASSDQKPTADFICCYGTAPDTPAPTPTNPTPAPTVTPTTLAPTAGNGTGAPIQSGTSVNAKMLYVFTITETAGLGQVASVSLYRKNNGLFPELEVRLRLSATNTGANRCERFVCRPSTTATRTMLLRASSPSSARTPRSPSPPPLRCVGVRWVAARAALATVAVRPALLNRRCS